MLAKINIFDPNNINDFLAAGTFKSGGGKTKSVTNSFEDKCLKCSFTLADWINENGIN